MVFPLNKPHPADDKRAILNEYPKFQAVPPQPGRTPYGLRPAIPDIFPASK
ncbi:hypothetical protein NEILACOT_03126, partial [Neisseria lactamica ATCC 23970]